MKKLFFAFTLAIASCSGSENLQPTELNRTHTAGGNNPAMTVCYIICDFSASQGSNSRQTIIRNANTIFKAGTEKGYWLRYYDIGAPQFVEAFFECKITGGSIMSGGERRQLQDSIRKQRDTLNKVMTKLCQPPFPKNTCILTAISKVANSLSSNAGENNKTPIKIAILSDMLEDCNYHFGSINIEKGDYKTALATIAKMTKPRFTFAGKNVEFSFVASSNLDIKNYEQLFEFWKQVLAKFDYELKTAISSDLPNWAINN
jgi:hypothetical protein